MGNYPTRAVLSAFHAKIQRLWSIHKRQKIWFRDSPNLRIGTEIPYFGVGVATAKAMLFPIPLRFVKGWQSSAVQTDGVASRDNAETPPSSLSLGHPSLFQKGEYNVSPTITKLLF